MRKKHRLYFIFLTLVSAYVITIHNWEKLRLRVAPLALKQAVALTNASVKVTDTILTIQTISIRTVMVGDTSLPILLLLHGAPSSIKGWQELYLDTQFTKKYCLLMVDRPGYGYSQFGEPVQNIATAGGIVNAVVKGFAIKKPITILGSSYGGAVALEAVAQQPSMYKKLILLSASLQPSAEKTYDISYAIVLPVLKWLCPTVLVTASQEKLSHTNELKKLNNWQKIRCNTVIIHGTADDLIYYSNAQFAHGKLTNATTNVLVSLPGKGHALIFSNPEYLKRILKIYL